MAVLCDTQIRELVPIEPFADNVKRPGRVSFGVSSYGYDVRVGSVFKVFTNVDPTGGGGQPIVDPKQFGENMFVTIDTDQTGSDHVVIPPNRFALAETVEMIRIPRDMIAICVGKSTYARCGIIVNVTPLEPEAKRAAMRLIALPVEDTCPI